MFLVHIIKPFDQASVILFWPLEEETAIESETEITQQGGKSTQSLSKLISIFRAPSENACIHLKTRGPL